MDGAPEKRPGLLVEWRTAASDGGWEGRVVYLAQLRATGWVVVEEWVHETLLAPA